MMLRVLVRWLAASACVGALVVAVACGDEGSTSGGAVADGGAARDGSGATGGSAGTGGAGGSAATDGSGGCTATSDCPTGQVCDTAGNSCVQCLIDGDCATGTRCISNTCQVPSTCVNSLDCAAGQYPVCDTATGQCVQCVVPNDCPDSNSDCINYTCTPYVPCSSSLDCPNRQVCNPEIGRCVECVDSPDCGDTRVCAGGTCRIRCESDNQCTPLGLLCSPGNGYCVECLRDDNCVQSRYCASGVCAPDVCTPGAQRCQDNAVQTCNAVGSGWTSAACSAYQTCKDTAGTPACHDWICTPNTSQCDQGTERVMQCSADGLAQAVLQDCGSQVCVAATCKPVVCTPAGTRRCAGNLVYQCSVKGDAETVYDTCTTLEYCDLTTTTCQTKICTPDAAACDGNVATTCNSIGSGYTGARTDCSTTSQPFCVNGACSDQLCSPFSFFCENGVVRQCAADGLSATLYQTCTTNQYCDDATATCKPKVCTPNAPACNGNSRTTCNALGSGYLDAGTPCGSLYCVNGTCQTALFAEDFEDGDYVGWTEGTALYSRTVTTATAANGTTRSLQLTKTATTSNGFDGIFRTFAALTPTNISWYSRTTTSTATSTNYAPYITLGSTTSTTGVLLSHYIYRTSGSATTGTMYLSAGSPCSSVTFTVNINTWYFVEFRNINWSLRTFDYYVDGVQRPATGTSCLFQGTGTSVSRLDLAAYSPNSTALVDEIVFR